MLTYRELYFKGEENSLNKFIAELKNFKQSDWYAKQSDELNYHYLYVYYVGNKYPKAFISICFNNEKIASGCIKVGNIVPLEKDELSLHEYNDILVYFYEDVLLKKIAPKCAGVNFDISKTDKFEPTNIISECALQKLRSFMMNANQSTLYYHPCDEERWFDFICQTVIDEQMFDEETLSKFLQDQDYWKEKSLVGGNIYWDEKSARKLAEHYNLSCNILNYYIRKVNNKNGTY